MFRLRRLAQVFLDLLRELGGENDYARYRAAALAQGRKPLPADVFFLERLERKYSRPNRCC